MQLAMTPCRHYAQAEEADKFAASEYGADIIYDTTNDGWDCCVSSEGVLDCQDPSNFTVAAPAPANMVVVMQLNTPVPSEILTTGIGEISSAESIATTSSQALTTSATISVSTVPSTSQAPIYATPTSTRSTTATAAASSGTATKTQAGMNGGAKAGIAVGCVLAALLIVSIAILLYRRRKTQTARATAGYGNVEQSKTASHSTYRESSSSEGMYRQSAYQSQYPLLELMSPDQPSAKKMPGIGVAEMSTGADLEARHELHGDERLAHELPGSKVA